MSNSLKILNILTIAMGLAGMAIPTASLASQASTPMPVFVSIQPQANFVERIGGDKVSVDVLIPPGKSPAMYSPTPGQMAKLAKARVYFRIGVPFENALMPKIENMAPNTKVVDTRHGITLRTMAAHHHHEHEGEHHEHEGEHHDHDAEHHKHDAEHHDHGDMDHGAGKDPHIWLDPMLVKIQAQNICKALVEMDPAGKAEYEANLQAFSKDLDALHHDMAKALAPVKGSTVFVFHPTFGYLCDSYGLTQMAIEMEGKSPKGKELANFIAKSKHEKVRVIFVQPQFDQNAARKIAGAINGAVVSINPLERDYLKNMHDMAKVIAESLEK